MPTPAELRDGVRLLQQVPAALRRPIGAAEAREAVARRLAEREADFLGLAREALFAPAGAESPQRRLLDLAGCEYGDLERLVRLEGLEGALHAVYRRGVYLTVDEAKGRAPVVRGSTTFRFAPVQLLNPLARADVQVSTGASRGDGSRVPLSLAHQRERVLNHRIDLDLRDAHGWRHALCGAPGGSTINQLMRFSLVGAAPVRWFTTVDPAAPTIHPRYRWGHRLLHWGARLGGVRLPRPELVSLDDPLPIVRWMVDELRRGRTPHLRTYVSVAVRVCQAALAAGVDLGGARFSVVGEPLTAARVATIRRAGAEVISTLGTMETGILGTGCLSPVEPDDHHWMTDLHAVVQPGPALARPGLPERALLITSLRASAALLLLNTSQGDQAILESRPCGCPLEAIGWRLHAHTVRSFEKLTAGGMTFLDVDVIRVLEEVLPARFGGGPTDYQLVEDEDEDEQGQPRLRLLVHPRLGPLDEPAVAEAFLSALGAVGDTERVMELVWRDARLVRVERRPPLATPVGKILHLHKAAVAAR